MQKKNTALQALRLVLFVRDHAEDISASVRARRSQELDAAN